MPIDLITTGLFYRDGNGVYQPVIANTPNQQLEDGSVTNTKLAPESVSKVFSGTLTAAGWQGTTAPFSQAVTISGVLATDEPIIDLIPSDTYTIAIEEDMTWGNIYRAVTAADTITFYAKEKPTVALNFKARCIRK